jgi:uncharacterized membrane protein YkvA (DUF1232 family)
MPTIAGRWRQRARELKALVRALWIAYRDPRTPALARVVAALVVGYALSPIDLIPDVIPVLGYLDDLVLIPLGVALAVRLIPAEVWADARAEADRAPATVTPAGRVAAVVIVILWLMLAVVAVLLLRRWW